MKSKRVTITIVLCIALVITFIMLTSYALWRVKDTQSDSNLVVGACLEMEIKELEDENNNFIGGFTLEDAWPISDQEGLRLTGYTFKIKNTCSKPVNYEIVLESLKVDGKTNSDYFDNKYIKVKLDNKPITKYSEEKVVENDTTASYINDIRETRHLLSGTIPGKSTDVNNTDNIKEYNLKLWISEDAPNSEIGKVFKSKIKVIAGQDITPESNLKLLSVEGNPEATIDNIHIGDLVGFETEQFYVIGIDGNNVRLLSRYLLNAGPYTKAGETEGLQEEELGVKMVNNEYVRYYCDSGVYCGSIKFSEDNYWWDDENNNFVSPYTFHSFIYNDQSNLKPYVDAYVKKLQNMGLSVINGTLLSIYEVGDLCSTDITNILASGKFGTVCPSYLFERNYWLGSISYSGKKALWTIDCDGWIVGAHHDYIIGGYGIRPVIVVTI